MTIAIMLIICVFVIGCGGPLALVVDGLTSKPTDWDALFAKVNRESDEEMRKYFLTKETSR